MPRTVVPPRPLTFRRYAERDRRLIKFADVLRPGSDERGRDGRDVRRSSGARIHVGELVAWPGGEPGRNRRYEPLLL